ncbi:MAG TPA: ABC transporter permease [Candidatus Angelobacter sp.]|nr:ABC transporter permease [Candidatus Angelobacter sp.]
MGTLLQDLRYCVRMLQKYPAFATVAVFTLAVSMGANTVVFSILNALYLRTAPVRKPQELVVSVGEHRDISLPEYLYYVAHAKSFTNLAAEYPSAHAYFESGENPRILLGSIVSANYFELLGLKPLLGRFFLPQDGSHAEAAQTVVLSYRFWQSDFAADTNVIGKTIKLNGVRVTVIGVAPRQFHRLFSGSDNDFWLLSGAASYIVPHCDPSGYRCDFFTSLVGRLKPGEQVGNAQAEINGLAKQWETAYPDLTKASFVLYKARGIEPGSRREISHLPPLLLVAVAVLLLIACANLSGLLLARGVARRREIAIRLALGAGRARIVRQLLAEAALLSFLGSACGLLLLLWSKPWLSHFPFAGTEGFSSFYDVQLDWRVLLATSAVAILAVLIFGTMPALQTSKAPPAQSMKSHEASGARHSHTRSVLVMGQVALAVVLAAGAVLVYQSLGRVLMGHNFDPRHIAVLRVSPYRLGYAPEKSAQIQKNALRRIANLPGVESVSFGQLMPWWESWENWVAVPGNGGTSAKNARIFVHYNSIAPGYLRTLKIPLLQGREFADADCAGAPNVVIVNQTLASQLWPNRNPIGQTLLMGGVRSWAQSTATSEIYTVVGVAADAQYNPATDAAHTFMYLPYWQVQNNGDGRFVVRTGADPGSMLPQIKRVIRNIDANVPVGEDSTLVQALLNDFGAVRLLRAVLAFAGIAALLLASVGLYSILAFLVAQRRREIGIRLALGATRRQILNLFLRQGMRLAVPGTLAGLIAALLSLRILSRLLYGIAPADPLVLGAVLLGLGAVCALASYVPARRATKLDPMVALRYE